MASGSASLRLYSGGFAALVGASYLPRSLMVMSMEYGDRIMTDEFGRDMAQVNEKQNNIYICIYYKVYIRSYCGNMCKHDCVFSI